MYCGHTSKILKTDLIRKTKTEHRKRIVSNQDLNLNNRNDEYHKNDKVYEGELD